MRSALFLVSAAFLLFVFAGIPRAQSAVVGPAAFPQVAVDVAEQPGCPIRIVVGEIRHVKPVAVTLSVQNAGERPIRAYVIAVDSGKEKRTYTVMRPERPLEPGQALMLSVGTQNQATVSLSVDHVEFTNTGSWGGDAFGRSKIIAAYLEGRELAVARLKELLGAEDPTDFLAALHVFGGYTLSGPVYPDRPGMIPMQRLKGYRNIIDILRRTHKRTQQAQDLARKLELMENTVNQ